MDQQTTTIPCSKCGTEHPHTIEFFPPNKSCRNGITRTCRPCSRLRQKRYYTSENGRATRREVVRRYRATSEGRKKHRARCAVQQKIRSGKMTRPASCQRCGETPPKEADGRSTIHFHHTKGYDWEKRFVGEWLCRSCHDKEDEND